MNTPCPDCGKTLRQDEKYLSFADGKSPAYSLTLKFRAEWCAEGKCEYYKITELKTPARIP